MPMKAIKFILITIGRLYASIFGLNEEVKSYELKTPVKRINIETPGGYYIYSPTEKSESTYKWYPIAKE
jgi:hypothetical protein